MKKNKNTTDKSAPYRYFGFNRIVAPNKPNDVPKGSIIKAGCDLRDKGGKA